jgi:hypothetical protein
MTILSVWLLVMVSGGIGAVQPVMFQTAEACEQFAQAAPVRGITSDLPTIRWRCIPAEVVKP